MRVTLPAGFESISGSIKQKNGSKLVFKTFKRPSVNRTTQTETRAYIMQKHERKTPLSDNEIAARQRFKEASEFVAKLSKEQKSAFADQYKIAKGRFNGKHYNTIRGYIVARYYAEYRQSADQNGDK